ncbi:MAG: hypothetical protein HY905_15790 [Deltaproteobacteria bacterium]|nr:hypothetical protein [Deltaproteobacteria bacterium]
MAKTNETTDLGGIAHGDLLYAVRSLVSAGKTTTLEVARLAGERSARITALEAELAVLKVGGSVSMDSVAPAPRKRGRPRTRPPTVAKPVGSKVIRKDGRSFTVTAAVVESRRLQGQYLGNLRKVPEKERDRYRAIVKAKGVAAAVAAIKKRLRIA